MNRLIVLYANIIFSLFVLLNPFVSSVSLNVVGDTEFVLDVEEEVEIDVEDIDVEEEQNLFYNQYTLALNTSLSNKQPTYNRFSHSYRSNLSLFKPPIQNS